MNIPESTSVSHAINEGAFVLREAGIGNGRTEAFWLAEHVLGHRPCLSASGGSTGDFRKNRVGEPGERFTSAQYQEFFSLVGRRAQRIPLQHVMGVMFFRKLKLRARLGVFVVRPETEWVAQSGIQAAGEWVRQGVSPRVLDLGCGSGALGLAVANEVPGVELTSVDVNAKAVALTRENAKRCGISARVLQADVTNPTELLTALADISGMAPGGKEIKTVMGLKGKNPLATGETPRFHVIVTNPPYVIDPVTQPEAAADPPEALYGGGSDGLEIPKKFLATAVKLLAPGATLVMEHGETQGQALRLEAQRHGLCKIRTQTDLTHRPRFMEALMPR